MGTLLWSDAQGNGRRNKFGGLYRETGRDGIVEKHYRPRAAAGKGSMAKKSVEGSGKLGIA